MIKEWPGSRRTWGVRSMGTLRLKVHPRSGNEPCPMPSSEFITGCNRRTFHRNGRGERQRPGRYWWAAATLSRSLMQKNGSANAGENIVANISNTSYLEKLWYEAYELMSEFTLGLHCADCTGAMYRGLHMFAWVEGNTTGWRSHESGVPWCQGNWLEKLESFIELEGRDALVLWSS